MEVVPKIHADRERRAGAVDTFMAIVAGLLACLFGGLCGCDADLEPESEESAAAVESTRDEEPNSEVVAVVNDREIYRDEVEERLDRIDQLYRHSRRSFDDDVRAAKRQKVMEQLIDRELLLDQINRRDLEIDTELVDQAVERRIESEFGSPAAFRRYLDAQNITVAEFRSHIREELAIGELLSDEEVSIDEDHLRDHYERIANRRPAQERVLVSSVSLRLAGGGDDEQRREVESAVEEFLADAASPSDLTQLGDELEPDVGVQLDPPRWFERDHLDASTARLLFDETTEEGASEVVETRTGLDFYWVHEQREAGIRDFDEVKELLRERAQRGHQEKRRRRLVKELRDDASITVNLPDESQPFVDHDD